MTSSTRIRKTPHDFAVPRKRIRIVDIAEGDSLSSNYEKYLSRSAPKKVPKLQEDEEFLEPHLLLSNKPAPVAALPASDEVGEEYTGSEEIFIRPQQPLINPKLSLKDTGSTSVVFVPLPTERIQNSSEVVNAEDWQHKDRPLGRGLASCLELLRERKELGGQKAFGRTKDKAGSEELQHLDGKGRVLSKKQAFRQQCYFYHNQKPSQNKIKKMKDREEAEIKEQKLDPVNGPESFKITKNIMEKTKNPYVVLSNL